MAKGLSYLARQQSPDGALAAGENNAAITGLGLLAFLSCGDTPDVGRFGLVVRQACDYLLSQQAPDGYFGSGDRGMYAHAIVTLVLAEAYGVELQPERRTRTREALVRAVQVIFAAQNVQKSNPAFVGGWRYTPTASDSDLSLSGWNVMALEAAQDIGIEVPAEARNRAAQFVMRCYKASSKGFGYQPDKEPQIGDTAIGMVCLAVLDPSDKNAAVLDAAAGYLDSHHLDGDSRYPYYATYYVAWATFQHGGRAWEKVGSPALERLIKSQENDGGWTPAKSAQEPGRTYATAMAVAALAVPDQLLPLYQR